MVVFHIKSNFSIKSNEKTLINYISYTYLIDTYIVEEDRGTGTRENKGGRWRESGSGRRRNGMRKSCEGGRQEKNEGHQVF